MLLKKKKSYLDHFSFVIFSFSSFQGFRFYLLSYFEDFIRPSKVDICRGEILQGFVVALVVIAVHKYFQSGLQFIWTVIMMQFHHIFIVLW